MSGSILLILNLFFWRIIFPPKIVQYSIVYKFCHVKNFYIKLFLFLQHVNFVEVNFVNYIFLLVFTVLNSLIVTLQLSFTLTPPPDICTLLSHIPKKRFLKEMEWGAISLLACGGNLFPDKRRKEVAGVCIPKRERKKYNFLPEMERCAGQRIDRTVESQRATVN